MTEKQKQPLSLLGVAELLAAVAVLLTIGAIGWRVREAEYRARERDAVDATIERVADQAVEARETVGAEAVAVPPEREKVPSPSAEPADHREVPAPDVSSQSSKGEEPEHARDGRRLLRQLLRRLRQD